MKTEFKITKTGTKVLYLEHTNSIGTTFQNVLFTDKGDIIAIFNDYTTFETSEKFELTGDVLKYYIIVSQNLTKYGCLFNERSEFFTDVSLAKKIQVDSFQFYYENTISDILKTINTSNRHVYRELYEAKDKIKNLQLSLEQSNKNLIFLQKYGTVDTKTIDKIIDKQKKAAAKVRNAKIKAKVMELKSELKKGNCYIAVLRNYSNKGRKYLGESVEYRTSKPTTQKYYFIDKMNLLNLAEKLV